MQIPWRGYGRRHDHGVLCLLILGFVTRGCQAIIAEGNILYNWKTSSLNDPQGKLSSWISGTDPCPWQHILCDSNLRITRIDLGNSDLSGTLTSSLGDLSMLLYLELYSNNLSGPIPSELGNLANLLSLDLYQNKFSGTIPPSLSNCTQLNFL